MKTKLMKVYICEHCGRKMLGAGAMSRHEKYCSDNPNNKHKCFDLCRHLEKGLKTIEVDRLPYTIITMKCKKTGKSMYSYKLEKKLTFDKSYIKGMIRMPLECDLFESMHESGIY